MGLLIGAHLDNWVRYSGGGQDESRTKAVGTPDEGEDGSEAPTLPDAQGPLPDLWMVTHCTGMELVWNRDLQVMFMRSYCGDRNAGSIFLVTIINNLTYL